jgi:hypothetical protein
VLNEKWHNDLIDKLKKRTIPPRILLGKFNFPKDSCSFSDYAPFFYYLGSELKPKHLAEFDCGVGVGAGCCVLGSKSTKVSLFLEKEARFADTNVRLAGVKPKIYVGKLTDSFLNTLEEVWDLAIVRNSDFLEFIWNKLNYGGIICMIGNDKSFCSFCKTKNRDPVIFKIRDGIFLVEK